jgi:hypothetical protein
MLALLAMGSSSFWERKRIARVTKLNDRHSVPARGKRQGLLEEKKFEVIAATSV